MLIGTVESFVDHHTTTTMTLHRTLLNQFSPHEKRGSKNLLKLRDSMVRKLRNYSKIVYPVQGKGGNSIDKSVALLLCCAGAPVILRSYPLGLAPVIPQN